MWLVSKLQFAILFLLLTVVTQAQELYVYTEPASNMAANSMGIRLNNSFMKKSDVNATNYQLVPELMFGISKEIMVHADAFFSNRNQSFDAEGASIYGKYRFFSVDDVQKHFRMAVFARISVSNNRIDQEEINLYGQNSGWETGIIATQLVHKVALSSAISFVKALDNGNNDFPFDNKNSKAMNYTLSLGKLMLPKAYKNYKQPNLNLMLEFLNQYNTGSGKYYIDVAPSVQLIFNSQSRIDIGYRQQLTGSLNRMTPNSFFIRLEHNLFNIF